jgi:hypothetical protein
VGRGACGWVVASQWGDDVFGRTDGAGFRRLRYLAIADSAGEEVPAMDCRRGVDKTTGPAKLRGGGPPWACSARCGFVFVG